MGVGNGWPPAGSVDQELALRILETGVVVLVKCALVAVQAHHDPAAERWAEAGQCPEPAGGSAPRGSHGEGTVVFPTLLAAAPIAVRRRVPVSKNQSTYSSNWSPLLTSPWP